MIRQHCPICQSDQIEKFHDEIRGAKNVDVIRCRHCHAMHLDKDFDQARLNKYYEDEYRKEFTSELNMEDSAEKFFRDKRPLARKRIELSRDYLSRKGKDANYLEIGCGPGYFLHELREFSSNLYGLELASEHANYAKKLGFQVVMEPLEKARFDVRFDIIFLFHVLEHVADPEGYLTRLKSHLIDDGQIILEVPGITDPLIGLYRIPAFRSFYFQEPHLYYFSEESFRILANQVGLESHFKSFNQYGLVNHISWVLTGKSNIRKRADGNSFDFAFENRESGESILRKTNDEYLLLLQEKGFYDTLFVILSKRMGRMT